MLWVGACCGLADPGRTGGQGAGRAALFVRSTLIIQGPLMWKFGGHQRDELGKINIKARTTTTTQNKNMHTSVGT